MPKGFRTSAKMMGDVGLDFDDDLQGLKKDAPVKRLKLHGLWVCLIISIPFLLMFSDVAFGLGLICGIIFCLVGVLAWDSA